MNKCSTLLYALSVLFLYLPPAHAAAKPVTDLGIARRCGMHLLSRLLSSCYGRKTMAAKEFYIIKSALPRMSAQDRKEVLNKAYYEGNTLLHQAAFEGRLSDAVFLLEHDAKQTLFHKNNNNQIPLHLAAFSGHVAMVNFLLNAVEQELGKPYLDQGLLFIYAVRGAQCNPSKAITVARQLFVCYGPSLIDHNVVGLGSMLHVAVSSFSVEMVRFILENGGEKQLYAHNCLGEAPEKFAHSLAREYPHQRNALEEVVRELKKASEQHLFKKSVEKKEVQEQARRKALVAKVEAEYKQAQEAQKIAEQVRQEEEEKKQKAKQEAQRIAAEQERKRVHAQEQQELAAVRKQARLQKRQERAKKAAEQEKIKAEQRRLAQEQKAAREAAQQAELDALEREEQKRRGDAQEKREIREQARRAEEQQKRIEEQQERERIQNAQQDEADRKAHEKMLAEKELKKEKKKQREALAQLHFEQHQAASARKAHIAQQEQQRQLAEKEHRKQELLQAALQEQELKEAYEKAQRCEVDCRVEAAGIIGNEAERLVDNIRRSVQEGSLASFNAEMARYKHEVTHVPGTLWQNAFNNYYYQHGIWLPSFAAHCYFNTPDRANKKTLL